VIDIKQSTPASASNETINILFLKQNEVIFDYAEKDKRVDLNRKLRFSSWEKFNSCIRRAGAPEI